MRHASNVLAALPPPTRPPTPLRLNLAPVCFSRTAPECTTVSTCTPWRALWSTSCAPSRIQWKVRLPFLRDRPRVGGDVGGGGERSCSPKRPERFGGGRWQAPAAPRAVLFFHTPAYFLPCLELNTFATSCTLTRPSSSWSCCYLTWAEPTRGDTMVLLTSLLRSACLISCRCEQEHK